MKHYNADLELALLHIKQVEQRVADQYLRVERLRRMGAPTAFAEDLLRALRESHMLLKLHLAHVTGPVSPTRLRAESMREASGIRRKRSG